MKKIIEDLKKVDIEVKFLWIMFISSYVIVGIQMALGYGMQ